MTDPRRLLDDGSDASPALRALLASARRADDPRAPQIEALSARIATAVGPVAPVAPVAPLASAPPAVATAVASAGHIAFAVKAGAVIAALGALGGGVWYVRASRDDARPHVETRLARELDAGQPAATVTPGVPDDAPAEIVVSPPPPVPSPDKRAPPRPVIASKKPRGAGDSEAETRLVVDAGAALVRGDAEAALALTRQHLAQFPSGAHAEERDRIAIEALTRLGGLEDARAAADRFFLRYPRSIYRPRIEGLVR